MKQLKIVKIYDASNANDTWHLINRLVACADSLEWMYSNPNVLKLLSADYKMREPFEVQNPDGYHVNYKYIAEFEVVEDGE